MEYTVFLLKNQVNKQIGTNLSIVIVRLEKRSNSLSSEQPGSSVGCMLGFERGPVKDSKKQVYNLRIEVFA